jgi:hypothetical protein
VRERIVQCKRCDGLDAENMCSNTPSRKELCNTEQCTTVFPLSHPSLLL